MDRLEFGVLVSILREDLRLTQVELAEKTGLAVDIISNVERGERRGLLKDELLLKLAAGLQLTSLERREFFFAATGVSDKDVMCPDDEFYLEKFDPEKLFQEIKAFIANSRFPTLVLDSYSDILLANNSAIAHYNVPPTLMANADSVIGGFNSMRIVFHKESSFKSLVSKDWELHTLLNLRAFRRRILRYRCKKYARDLIAEFLNNKEYSLFERYWRKTLVETSDILENSVPLSASPTGIVGLESFLATTPYGELYLYQLVPNSVQASQLCSELISRAGEGCSEFAPFPDERKE